MKAFLSRNAADAEQNQDDNNDQEEFVPEWEIDGDDLAIKRKAILIQLISALVRGMKARLGPEQICPSFADRNSEKKTTKMSKKQPRAVSTKSQDLETQLFEHCQNENMTRGFAELKKQDTVQRHAALLIQIVWRHRRQERVDEIQKRRTLRNSCYAVDAPAYFGESCLWAPIHTWGNALLHEYTIRVKSQVEIVCIPRSAIAMCIEKFSPWLRNRCEVFQSTVLEEKATSSATTTERDRPASPSVPWPCLIHF